MVKTQICYCEYCGASFTGEKSESECAKHELTHLKNIVADEVEMFCQSHASVTSIGIAPQALLVPFMGGSNTLKQKKYFGVYKLSNFYDATADPEGTLKNARKHAKSLAQNDVFFRPEYVQCGKTGSG